MGFGEYHYRSSSGREGDWPLAGFSPRKREFSLYFTCDASKHKAGLKRLGKRKTGKGCVYVKCLEDIDMDVLRDLVKDGIRETLETYGA